MIAQQPVNGPMPGAPEGRIAFGEDRDAITPLDVIEAWKGEGVLLDTRKAD